MSELRGKLIPVKAKRRIEGIFEVGDELSVQSILYNKPKLLVNALCGAFNGNDEALGMIGCPPELSDEPIGTKLMMDSNWNNGQYLIKMFDATFAPIGSYNYSVIILTNGMEYNTSILGHKSLSYAFDKIN
tara:strand:+ start:42190 stop:42582 length:393 start_codon:yes stop_codon:yes gene_type:complete